MTARLYRTLCTFLLPALLGCFAGPAVHAETVSDLYTATVPVAQRSDAALAEAATEAMSQVMIKLSGSDAVLSYPGVQAALPGARALVQQYAYEGGQGAEPLQARIAFDAAAMSRVITDAGAPLWTANRPATLAWIVLEDAGGRRFLTPDTDPELAAALLAAFNQRGVPLKFPLFDLTDATAVSTEEVWRFDSVVLQSASARYGAGDVLAGRFAVLSSGEWLGDWTYIADRRQRNRTVNVSPDQGLFVAAAALVAADMASRYAVTVSSNAASGGIAMQVDGITSYSDYAGVVSWLEGLELIRHANVESVSGDRIILRLDASAPAQQLAIIIELNDSLVPAPVANADGGLYYLWQR